MIATEPAVQTTWTLPKMPAGDSAAARRMAAELRCLAEAVTRAQRQVDDVLSDLETSWRGTGARTMRRPSSGLSGDAALLRRALLQAADALDSYAHQYDRAHEHHGWSWGRIAAVATVVAVTATAVTVTVASAGTATAGAVAAEAAVVGAEAEAMAGAAATASGAAVEAAEAVSLATRALSALQGIGDVVLPRLYIAAVEAPTWMSTPLGSAAVGGATAVGYDLADGGRVHPLDVLFGAALGYGEGVASGSTRTRPPALEQEAAVPVVPRTSTWGDPDTLVDHAQRHGPDFGLSSPEAYERAAHDWYLHAIDSGALVKIDRAGTIRVYEPATNTFGSYRPDLMTRTFFKPKAGLTYWLKQPGQDVS